MAGAVHSDLPGAGHAAARPARAGRDAAAAVDHARARSGRPAEPGRPRTRSGHRRQDRGPIRGPAGRPVPRAPPAALPRQSAQAFRQVAQGLHVRQRPRARAAAARRRGRGAGPSRRRRELGGLRGRAAPDRARAAFYRTTTGVEVDLVLELPGGRLWAIEIKRAPAPKVERRLRIAQDDPRPDRTFLVYSGGERDPMGGGIEAIRPDGDGRCPWRAARRPKRRATLARGGPCLPTFGVAGATPNRRRRTVATPEAARTPGRVGRAPSGAGDGWPARMERTTGWAPRDGRGDGDHVGDASGAEAQAAHRHPDLPGDPRGRLLLRRQDRVHPPPRRRGQALFPVAPAPLRQEPAPRHHEGAVRGRRGAFRGAGCPRRLGLVGAPPRGAPRLQRRPLHRPGRPAYEPDGAIGRHRTTDGGPFRLDRRTDPLPATHRRAARTRGAARRRAGR